MPQQIRLPRESHRRQRRDVQPIPHRVHRAPAPHPAPQYQKQRVRLHQSVPTRFDRALRMSQRVRQERRRDDVVRHHHRRRARHAPRPERDPQPVEDDVRQEPLRDDERVERAGDAGDAGEGDERQHRDVRGVVRARARAVRRGHGARAVARSRSPRGRARARASRRAVAMSPQFTRSSSHAAIRASGDLKKTLADECVLRRPNRLSTLAASPRFRLEVTSADV